MDKMSPLKWCLDNVPDSVQVSFNRQPTDYPSPLALREQLKEAVEQLPKSAGLVATYTGPRGRGDLENLLIYIPGPTTFALHADGHLHLKHVEAEGTDADWPITVRYEISETPGSIAATDILARCAVRVPRKWLGYGNRNRVALWREFRIHAQRLRDIAGYDGTFGLHLELGTAGGRINLADKIKVLADTFIASLHEFDARDEDDFWNICQRVAHYVPGNTEEAISLLRSFDRAVLDRCRVPSPGQAPRQGRPPTAEDPWRLIWSPKDDRMIECLLTCDRGRDDIDPDDVEIVATLAAAGRHTSELHMNVDVGSPTTGPALESEATALLGDEEVSNDAVQLMLVSTFNGLCRLIASMSRNGSLTRAQIQNIHDAMTEPLDDPQLRDDEFVAFTRSTVEEVLARAMKDAQDAEE
jgi:hypothetical protein